MLIKFLVISGFLFAAPVYKEGAYDAVKEKGFKEALSDAWKEKEPLDYLKLND